jgi:hypothetical protein
VGSFNRSRSRKILAFSVGTENLGSIHIAQHGVTSGLPIIARAASLREEAAPFGKESVSGPEPAGQSRAKKWYVRFYASNTGHPVSGEAVSILSSDRLVSLLASHAVNVPRCAAPGVRPAIFHLSPLF